MNIPFRFHSIRWIGAATLAFVAAPVFSQPKVRVDTPMVWGVTASHQLIKFQSDRPQRIVESKPLVGLAPGETPVGMDFRVARGVLYTLTNVGKLYTVDTATGVLRAVGEPLAGLKGQRFGLDFNPTVDRIRVVGEQGLNWRVHPDTGALVSSDPDLAFADAGPVGKPPRVAAAAYTYNTKDDKLTTNFAIDLGTGSLLVQGTREGVSPAVSPNTGRLTVVGLLGTGPLTDASMDIADVDNLALAALASESQPLVRLFVVNLNQGLATYQGIVGTGERLVGLAIEP